MTAPNWRLVLRVLSKVSRHPAIALRRLLHTLQLTRLGLHKEHQRLLAFLAEAFAIDSRALSQEYRHSDWAAYARTRREALACFPGSYRFGTAPAFGCEFLYLLVRAAKPQVVVETGVLYGASSAAILAALARNGRGVLYSIDLGNPPHEPPHDFFIPSALQDRWHLIIGDSRRELPALLARLGTVDLFHHDSLHTVEHMMWEYATAWRYLSPRGVLSSDDVLSPLSLRTALQRHPFPVFCEKYAVRWGMFYGFGVAMGHGARSDARGREDKGCMQADHPLKNHSGNSMMS
jgi:predicted O-methyltransferase YrrM